MDITTERFLRQDEMKVSTHDCQHAVNTVPTQCEICFFLIPINYSKKEDGDYKTNGDVYWYLVKLLSNGCIKNPQSVRLNFWWQMGDLSRII